MAHLALGSIPKEGEIRPFVRCGTQSQGRQANNNFLPSNLLFFLVESCFRILLLSWLWPSSHVSWFTWDDLVNAKGAGVLLLFLLGLLLLLLLLLRIWNCAKWANLARFYTKLRETFLLLWREKNSLDILVVISKTRPMFSFHIMPSSSKARRITVRLGHPYTV